MITETPNGTVDQVVLNIVQELKNGEIFLDTLIDMLLEKGARRDRVYAAIQEAKTYLNLDLKRQFPKVYDEQGCYRRYAQKVRMTEDYIKSLDKMIRKYKLDNT